MPLERVINIAVNCPFWVEVANPEHPFTAMLISRSRGTCLIRVTRSMDTEHAAIVMEQLDSIKNKLAQFAQYRRRGVKRSHEDAVT